jgi:hypothetical protein
MISSNDLGRSRKGLSIQDSGGIDRSDSGVTLTDPKEGRSKILQKPTELMPQKLSDESQLRNTSDVPGLWIEKEVIGSRIASGQLNWIKEPEVIQKQKNTKK